MVEKYHRVPLLPVISPREGACWPIIYLGQQMLGQHEHHTTGSTGAEIEESRPITLENQGPWRRVHITLQ